MITPTFTLAVRQLTGSVVSTMFIVVSLSIAIGAVAGSYGLLDAVVWRRLAVREPEQLVTIAPMTGEAVLGMSGTTVAELVKAQTSFEGLCGFSRGAMPVEIASAISRRGMEAVSGDCYDMLGVRPHLGRLIGPADAPLSGNSATVVVISHALWTNALGADAEIIGRTLRVEGVELTIIGVLPASFMGLHVDQGPDIVLPLGLVSSLLGNKPLPIDMPEILDARLILEVPHERVSRGSPPPQAEVRRDDEPRVRNATTDRREQIFQIVQTTIGNGTVQQHGIARLCRA